MFQRLLRPRRNPNREVIEALYARIVAAARQPHLYDAWSVPDTPLGRFEMLALHMFLVLHRLRGEGEAAHALAQDLTDAFFLEVDHSLRELGIGDMGIPRRMKRLARMFYGRAASYGADVDAGDRAALAAALARNVRPEDAAWQHAAALADHVLSAHRGLAAQQTAALLAGRIAIPDAGSRGGEP